VPDRRGHRRAGHPGQHPGAVETGKGYVSPVSRAVAVDHRE
jgi:hypothetical protein